MDYKSIALKRNRKKIVVAIFFILMIISFGFYWNYKMNYEMIVKFTQLDESDPSFPFGERKIDASSWIKQGYKKIDEYTIYNPNVIPLDKNYDLVIAVSQCVEMLPKKTPILYAFFAKEGWLDDFLKKDIKIKYIYSTFNEYSNLPNNDDFLVTFDNYQIKVARTVEKGRTYLYAYDLEKIQNQSP